MPDDLSQLPAPGIGEVYRLLVRLEQRINELSSELRSKVVTLDVYQVAHQNLSDKVAATTTNMERHFLEHDEAAKTKEYHNVLLLAACITSAVSFLGCLGSVLATVIH